VFHIYMCVCAHTSSFLLHLFFLSNSVDPLPSPAITLPAIQSISAIVQTSSWYIAARWCLSVCHTSLTVPERVNHLGAVWSWSPFKYEVINECACVLIAYWKLEAEVQSVADSGLCQLYIYSLYVCVRVFS